MGNYQRGRIVNIRDAKKLYDKFGGTWGEINIFGIRNEENAEKDQFNDLICIATDDLIHQYQGTTDPSVYWTKNPMTAEGFTGAAHVCEGWHQNIWRVGIHAKGTNFAHEALIQTGNKIRIWRDVDKDFTEDEGEPIQSGYYGINCHRASSQLTEVIGYYSAGCQVIQRIGDFLEFMGIIKGSDVYLANPQARFSYLLVNKNQM